MMKMKSICKFIFTIWMLSISLLAIAQNGKIAEVYTHPAAWHPEEELKIYFDVTGTKLANETGPLYIWTWKPAQPDAKIGSWAESAETAKLEQVKDKDGNPVPNKWVFNMGKPTEFYGKTAGDVKEIHCLLKLKDGSKQTDNVELDDAGKPIIAPYDFTNVETVAGLLHPVKFDANKPVSIIVNVAIAEADGKPKVSNAGPVQMHSGSILGTQNWQKVVEYNAKPKDGRNDTKLTKVPYNANSTLWKIDLIPADYYGLSDSEIETFNGISCVFNGGSWETEAKNAGEDFLFRPVKDAAKGPSGIRFFPSKVTSNDLITIYFDSKEKVANATPLLLENEVYVKFTLNNTINVMSKMTKGFNNSYSLHIIPSITFSTDLAGAALSKLEYVYVNATETKKVEKDNGNGTSGKYEIVISN
jgi:hypothetical protein